MAGGKEIRTKIKSIESTQKITRAMEMVAASKMRKAQDQMASSRPYAQKMLQVIEHLAQGHPEYHHSYLAEREVKRVGYIVVSSDRGLCGGLNTNLFRALLRDMKEWADWWGVPFRFPSHFPFRTVTALRAAIVEPGVTDALYRAAWVEDRDLSDEDVVRGAICEAGLDGAAILERTRDPAMKLQLFTNTACVVEVGCCGAPSLLVDDTHLFWGQDRLDMVSDALAGLLSPTL